MLLSAIEISKQQYYSRISKKLMDLVEVLRPIGHFWKRFWSIRKYLAFLHYFMITNSFKTLGTKVNYLTIFLLNSVLWSTMQAKFLEPLT